MAQFPDVQAKAQAQLDEVLGRTLPTFDDMESLPYVTALVWEILRYYVVAPIGSTFHLWMHPSRLIFCVAIPHTAAENGTYGDYSIPKGAYVMSNLW